MTASGNAYDAIGLLFRVFPAGVLGVVLLFDSLELAASVRLDDTAREARYVHGGRRGWLRA